MVWGKTKVKPGTQHGSLNTAAATPPAASLEDLFAESPHVPAAERVMEEPEFAPDLEPLPQAQPQPQPQPALRRHAPDLLAAMERQPEPVRPRASEKSASHIGASVRIDGELSGTEDVSVEGTVEGIVSLQDHRLTVAAKGVVHAEIQARSVTVHGKVVGNIMATDVVQVMPTGCMEGDIRAGRVVLADGAKFRGNIQMGWEPEQDGAQGKERREKAGPAPATVDDTSSDDLLA